MGATVEVEAGVERNRRVVEALYRMLRFEHVSSHLGEVVHMVSDVEEGSQCCTLDLDIRGMAASRLEKVAIHILVEVDMGRRVVGASQDEAIAYMGLALVIV